VVFFRNKNKNYFFPFFAPFLAFFATFFAFFLAAIIVFEFLDFMKVKSKTHF
jgi:hypothetical protein